jgi:hypothetical protein
MNLLDLSGGTEILTYEECRELLCSVQIGRLAVVINGEPEIFPVNFGIDGDGIVFRTNRGRKLTGALLEKVVFEVDHIDVEARTGWSIVIHGRAEDISRFDGPGLKAKADEPWTGPKEALLRIRPESMTGRRVTAG